MIDEIICGSTLDVLKDMEAESIDCVITSPPLGAKVLLLKVRPRIIQGANLISYILSKCDLLRTKTRILSIMAEPSFIFLSPKLKQKFSLPLFNPQVRNDSSYKFYRLFVSELQRIKRLAVFGRRFLHPIIAAEKRMYQIGSRICDLLNSHPFLVCRSHTISISHTPRITLDGEITIGVHNASNIRQSLWFHNITLVDMVYNNHHSGG